MPLVQIILDYKLPRFEYMNYAVHQFIGVRQVGQVSADTRILYVGVGNYHSLSLPDY